MKEYQTPSVQVFEFASADILTASFTGSAPDSDDSEFG
jgi:hypothetical protein